MSYIIITGYNTGELLKSINNDYAAVLGTISNLLLVIVTLIYVMLIYDQGQQLEKTHKTSVTPILVPEIIKTHGTEYFGNRRQLSLEYKIKNIGDGPALQIYSKIELNHQYVESKDCNDLFEYSYLASLASMEEDKLHMHFEKEKIEKMIEDLSIGHAKNMYRIKVNPSQKSYSGPDIVIELIYSNIHGQFFKTLLSREILGLKNYIKNDVDNENDEIIYFNPDNKLKDDEPFELSLINPIFQSLEVIPLKTDIATKIIEEYEKLSYRARIN